MCENVITVYPGKVVVRSGGGTLRTSPLGSCIALSAFDPETGTGGLAHIMLPGAAPAGAGDKYKYSCNAVTAFVNKFKRKGIRVRTLKFVLAGGANVMKAENNSVPDLNIKAVLEELQERGLEAAFKSVGGYMRRVVELNLDEGILSGSLGSEKMKEIYFFGPDK